MGRSKKRSRASKARLNPLRNDSNTSSAKDASLVTEKIQPLLKHLQSAVPNDRNMAIGSISVLCEDPHMRQLLLKEKLVHIILTHSLNDDVKDIVIEAYGLLRNLTLEEGYDISIHLWRSNIWVSIKDGFNQIVTSLQALKAVDKNSIDPKQIAAHNQSKRLLFDYADNLISLAVALVNNSDDILEEVLSEQNLNIIFDLIINFQSYGLNILPTTLQNTILDLIYDFSSESLDFIDALLKCDPIISMIKHLKEVPPSNELGQILTQGIVLQLLDADEETKLESNQCVDLFQNVTVAVQNINIKQMREDMNLTVTEEVDVPKLKELAKKRQSAMMQLQAVEMGLDIITGIIEIIASLELDISEELSVILTSQLPGFFNSYLEEFPDRAFIGWNNLLWLFISTNEDIDNTLLIELWNKVSTFDDKDIPSIKMAKMSVMWVILKICGIQGNIDMLKEFNVWNNLYFVNSIIELYKNLDETEFRQRCCALLATVACFQAQDININERIGHFFIELLATKDTSAEILVEVTSAFFEIYSDSNFSYDLPVFVNGGFLAILKEKVSSNLKDIFKMVDKNKNPELKQKCTDTLNTLDSFIQYKTNEKS